MANQRDTAFKDWLHKNLGDATRWENIQEGFPPIKGDADISAWQLADLTVHVKSQLEMAFQAGWESRFKK